MVGRIRNDVDADARVFAGERREQPGQPPIPGVALGAHANDAGRVSGEQPDVFLRPDQVVENPPRALEHSPACGGKDHAASDPQEKRRIEPRLDLPQLVAQGRLGEMKA